MVPSLRSRPPFTAENLQLAATMSRWTLLRVSSVLSMAISSLPINALPAFTGVLARELRFQPGALGAFASANAIGGVFGGALAVVLMRHVAPRATAMIGLLLL